MSKHTPVIERTPPFTGGTQKIYRFPNDYGASVVQSRYSYGGDRGLWELAVVRFSGEENDSLKIVYDTPVTKDVKGFLTPNEVDSLLDVIESLPSKVEDDE